MTALCGGGTSAAKPGQEAALIYSSGLLVQVLESLALDWLAPLIPLVPLAPFVLSTFCASDPPAVVNLTMAEANALLQTDITSSDFATGLAKLPAIFENAIWNYSCQCTSGTYTPPTVTQPSGTTVVVQPQAPANAYCATSCFLNNGPGQPPCQQSQGAGAGLVGQLNVLAPSGQIPTGVSATWNWVSGATPTALQLTVKYNKTGASSISHVFNFPAGTAPISLVDTWPDATYTGVQIDYQYGAGSGTWMVEGHIYIWCGGVQPNGTQQPCCPPDAATQGYLDNILKMVTLIQRQQVPFSYVLGTVHSGLTGNGELSIQGLLGAKLTPTSIPGDASVDAGDPNTYWLDSWINWGNADGWTTREFLRSAPHISLPSYAGQFTKLGYSLRPGLTVDITELEREA